MMNIKYDVGDMLSCFQKSQKVKRLSIQLAFYLASWECIEVPVICCGKTIKYMKI